mgnify:FL=1
MRNNRKTIIMATVLLIVALLVTVYPVISNYLAGKNNSKICTEYFNAIGRLDNSAIDAARHKAEEYNAMLANGVSQTFSDEQINEAADDYNELLNLTGNGIMAYIEIPKLKIYLPVAHGTEAATLENAVGHVIGSSLPIGGNGTHAVLSGHSGMASEKMFSDLDQMKVGDVFFIHVLNETLAYAVDEINTVLPGDTSLLVIDRDKDLVTLITCTPFGVNTHRLLVRGSRIDSNTQINDADIESVGADEVESTWVKEYVKGIAVGVVILAACIIAYILIRRFQNG